MDLKELKIGYVPYLPDLSQPADRRRFPYFAKRNNIKFEIADIHQQYDIILLTAPSNLSKWLKYKKKNPDTQFIFEMVDSLIFSSDTFTTLFRGIGRFLRMKENLPYLNYKKLIIKWLSIADLVLCSSSELKNIINQWNKNVIVSLDYLEHEYVNTKTDYSIQGKMKLVWEGQGAVLPHFLHFKEVLEQVSSFCELHIITSEKYPLYGQTVYKNVSSLLKKLPIETIFHKWDLLENYKVFNQCDCGIIPLNKKNIFGWHKPANKLISFWFSGLPTIVSDTPAYTELMNHAGENLYCSNPLEWITKISEIRNMNEAERKALAEKNFNYVCINYSDATLDIIWRSVFEKIQSMKSDGFYKN